MDTKKLIVSTGSWARLVLVVIGFYALFVVRELVLVAITSIVIASAIEPIALWAKRNNIPRVLAILAVYVFIALVLAGLFYFMVLPVLGESANLIQNFTVYSEQVSPASDAYKNSDILSSLTDTFSAERIAAYLNSLAQSLSRGIFSGASAVFGGALSLILIVVLSFYLAVQEDGVEKFLRAVVPIKQEKYIIGLWKRSQAKIGRWMQGQLLLGVIVMVLSYLGLLLIGIPHALLLAVLAGIFELIPLFGPILSAIPAVVVAYMTSDVSTALIVAGLYLIIQQFENHLIYPLVVKKVVGVPPMVSILALLIGGQLAGFLGILIAVPLATILMELISDFEQDKLARLSAMDGAANNV